MEIVFKNNTYPFKPWKPADGRVMTRTFAFDTETTLIEDARPWVTPAYVLGAAFDGKQGVFVPRDHVGEFFAAHDDLSVVAHNAPFDLKVIQQVAPKFDIYKLVDENRAWDTLLLHQLLTLGTTGGIAAGKGQATLEHIAKMYLGFELSKDVTDAAGNSVRLGYGKFLNERPDKIPPVYLQYLALDVIATLRAYVVLRRRLANLLKASTGTYGYVSRKRLRNQVQQHGPQTHHIQLKAAVALSAISATGLNVDQNRRGPLAIELSTEAERLKTDLATHGYLPGKGSDKALQAILSRYARGLPNVQWRRTKTGKLATGKDVLADLAAHVPFVDLLLKYKAVSKLKVTFVDKLTTATVHPRFRTLTRSGRTSSYGGLNVQNLPREGKVRECFVPGPGCVYLAADYSTIELVTLAQACETQFGLESKMAGAIREGQDLHKLVAAQVTGKPLADVTKAERSKAKPINFGKPGGMGLTTLRAYAKVNYGVDLSEDEVATMSDGWFDTFPEMRAFLADEHEVVWTRVAQVLGLTTADHAAKTGNDRFLRRTQNAHEANRPNEYLGAMALKVAGDPAPKRSRDKQPYSPEDIAYLWEKLDTVKKQLPEVVRGALVKREPSYQLRSAVRSFCDRAGVFTLTGRLRAQTGYCERHNTVFQGLAADGAKIAMWKLWRAGLRVVNFIHDEFIVEVPEDANLTASAELIKTLMIDGMKEVVPTLPVKVEYAAMRRWSKGAEPVFDEQKRLLVWEPKPKNSPAPTVHSASM